MTTILVVEDETAIRALLCEEIEELGYSPRQAGHGLEGLEQVAAHRPDLIISDLSMPTMDGATFVTELRARYGDEAPPVLIVSALSGDEQLAPIRAAGVAGILQKPIDFDRLEDILETYLATAPEPQA